MAPSKKAIIIGGSLGGLFAANFMLREGWDVQVYERVAQELEGRGAGIVTHPELHDALRAAGIVVDETLGIQVQTRVALSRDGSKLGERACPQILTAWGRIYSLLREAFPSERYHNGKHFVSFAQDPSSVTARFSDGQEVQADLLIAADGLRSTIRQQLLPEVKPKYAGYVAWRGLVEESVLSERVLTDLFPYFAFDLPPQEQMLAYPVAGQGNSVSEGQRRYNFVWYRPADEGLKLKQMLTDANGKHWSEGIPPPLIRPELLEQTRAEARDVLSPQFAEVVCKTEQLFFQPIFDLESPQLAFGRIAILGDAAFVARPHCGMGVTKAGSDAYGLSRALKSLSEVPLALKVFEAERIVSGARVVAQARALGAYMQAQILTPLEREQAEKYRTPEAVMRETAVPF